MLNNYYNDILCLIKDNNCWREATRLQLYYASKVFFNWLLFNGYNNLYNVDRNVILKYYMEHSPQKIGLGLKHLRNFMRSILMFLYEQNFIKEKLFELFLMPIPIPKRLLSAVSNTELNAILDVAKENKHYSSERDYAILLLACITGLRACDIVNLKLQDIDWHNGEIKIIQKKTGRALYIPLTQDIGIAIKNYILNSRPRCNDNVVFLRLFPPIQGINRSAVGTIYNKYLKQAGVAKEPHDGKSLHGLRRAMGTRLLTSGSNLNMVAQALGHKNLRTVDKYIALDDKNLVKCALDFSGIEPTNKREQ